MTAHPFPAAPPVRVVAWELTGACNLSCPYCRASAGAARSGELSPSQALDVVTEIRSLGTPVLILSGGEPLLHPHWAEIASCASGLGLTVALATNGTLIDHESVGRMLDNGVHRVSVSLDHPDASPHDVVRGKGAYAASMGGIAYLREGGVPFQINMTVGADNVKAIGGMLKMAVSLGAAAFHIFFVVDVGRAAKGHLGIETRDYEAALSTVAELERTSPIDIKVTCAPQYERIRAAAGLGDNPRRRVTRGCLAGCGFLFISATGEVKPCGYFDLVLGRIGEKPLKDLWAANPVMTALRDLSRLKGNCASCEHVRTCGGCRARALSVTGDFLNPDPACAYNIGT